jgi:hypothetical protein
MSNVAMNFGAYEAVSARVIGAYGEAGLNPCR